MIEKKALPAGLVQPALQGIKSLGAAALQSKPVNYGLGGAALVGLPALGYMQRQETLNRKKRPWVPRKKTLLGSEVLHNAYTDASNTLYNNRGGLGASAGLGVGLIAALASKNPSLIQAALAGAGGAGLGYLGGLGAGDLFGKKETSPYQVNLIDPQRWYMPTSDPSGGRRWTNMVRSYDDFVKEQQRQQSGYRNKGGMEKSASKVPLNPTLFTRLGTNYGKPALNWLKDPAHPSRIHHAVAGGGIVGGGGLYAGSQMGLFDEPSKLLPWVGAGAGLLASRGRGVGALGSVAGGALIGQGLQSLLPKSNKNEYNPFAVTPRDRYLQGDLSTWNYDKNKYGPLSTALRSPAMEAQMKKQQTSMAARWNQHNQSQVDAAHYQKLYEWYLNGERGPKPQKPLVENLLRMS